MRFEATIDAFSAALNDSDLPPPPQTLGRLGAPDSKRFSVYRNNVAVGLIGSLENRFPVVRRLVGDDFFRAMARAYIAREKPRDAVLIHYGAGFPGFIAGFEPAKDLVYLADVARIENAWVESYHSAEAPVVSLADLAALAPERRGDTAFAFHPSVRLVRCATPAASIWAAHQGAEAPRAPGHWNGEDVLIARPVAEVSLRILPPGGFDFARHLQNGDTIAAAAEKVETEAFDPGPHLVGLIESGALCAIRV
jgi:Putative DNA-binding domain